MSKYSLNCVKNGIPLWRFSYAWTNIALTTYTHIRVQSYTTILGTLCISSSFLLDNALKSI